MKLFSSLLIFCLFLIVVGISWDATHLIKSNTERFEQIHKVIKKQQQRFIDSAVIKIGVSTAVQNYRQATSIEEQAEYFSQIRQSVLEQQQQSAALSPLQTRFSDEMSGALNRIAVAEKELEPVETEYQSCRNSWCGGIGCWFTRCR